MDMQHGGRDEGSHAVQPTEPALIRFVLGAVPVVQIPHYLGGSDAPIGVDEREDDPPVLQSAYSVHGKRIRQRPRWVQAVEGLGEELAQRCCHAVTRELLNRLQVDVIGIGRWGRCGGSNLSRLQVEIYTIASGFREVLLRREMIPALGGAIAHSHILGELDFALGIDVRDEGVLSALGAGEVGSPSVRVEVETMITHGNAGMKFPTFPTLPNWKIGKIQRKCRKRLIYSVFQFQIGRLENPVKKFSKSGNLEKWFCRWCNLLAHSVFQFQMGVYLEWLECPKYFLFQLFQRLYI